MNYRLGGRARLAALLGAVLSLTAQACAADAVTDWNRTLTQALKTAGLAPGRQPRQAAVVHAAIFDAVNGIEREYEPYLVKEWAPGGARPEAAAVQAAYSSLLALFPAQKALFDQQLSASLAQISGSSGNSQSIARGRVWGERVARAVLAARSTDGYSSTLPPFFGSTEFGVWRPVPPNGALPAVFQELAVMTPFAMTHPAQFQPGPPPALDSPEYASDLHEVQAWGSAASALRTAEQTQMARLWHAVDPADENSSVRELIGPRRDLVDNARLFALMNIAGADAFISVMDAKRTYNLWRPFHAIRLADPSSNPLTAPDPNWTPLIVAPRHQEYPSGHSIFTAAHFRVIEHLLGDNVGITIRSTGFPGASLTYARLSQATQAVQDSRVLGGIHFRSAVRIGGRDGAAIADYIVANFLRPRDRQGRGN